MAYSIEFTNVSKRYNLGLTRTSLPSLISNRIKRMTGRVKPKTAAEKYLWALKDVTFALEKGESLALIGANGAGKTTILKLLSNITRPTAGDIKVNGQLSALIELGAGFHPDLTGRENIFLNGAILGLKRDYIKRRFDEIVAFSEIERFIDTPVKRYSSGMTVRLGFAVAACIEPEILLVDEVLAVGDASFRHKCMERIRELLAAGTSLIFVSHNLWLAQAVCSQALYLERGRVKYRGPTAEVIDMYDRDVNMGRARKFQATQAQMPELANEDLEITGIEILDLRGRPGDLSNEAPAEIKVHYRANRPFAAANIVVRILRSDGLTCCMMRSSLDDFPLSLRQGEGVVSVTLEPLQLYGGAYFVQAIFRDAADAHGIVSKMSDSFYVVGSPLSHQEMNGVFEPNRRWRHEPAASFVWQPEGDQVI